MFHLLENKSTLMPKRKLNIESCPSEAIGNVNKILTLFSFL